MMDRFVLLEGPLSTRVWWRCTVVDSGELCVMMGLVKLMLTLFADNWDTLQHRDMITCHCEYIPIIC